MPIIKAKTHKYSAGLFRHLVQYLFADKGRSRDDTAWSYFHNLSTFTPEGIEAAFLENYSFAKQRTNGVALRHLILSFSPEDTPHLTAEIIQELVQKFLELRNEKGVVFGRLHEHDGHKHVHLLISGNQYRSDRSTRLSKAEFQQIHRDLEAHQIERYPHLSHSLVKKISQKFHDRDQPKPLSEPEIKMKERLQDKPTHKDLLRARLRAWLEQATSTKAFYDLLEQNGFEPYEYRGKIRGFLKDGHKFRFSTIGISQEMIHELMSERERRLAILQENRSILNQNREITR